MSSPNLLQRDYVFKEIQDSLAASELLGTDRCVIDKNILEGLLVQRDIATNLIGNLADYDLPYERKIYAIKLYRMMSGCSLKEAKDFIEEAINLANKKRD